MTRRIFFLLLFVAVWSCSDDRGRAAKGDDGSDYVFDSTRRKYEIKAATVYYETAMNTASVNYNYKTTVYFDDYGIKECRDTYKGDTLAESLMSNGVRTYRIMHLTKKAFLSGRARAGTEPKFGWDEARESDKESGKIRKEPNETIAGLDCEVYSVKSGEVTAKYAGWKDVIMLSEIKSPGGSIATRALRVDVGPPPPEKFRIPEGYKIQ